ncbi:uncharacterized protein LOC131019033 [Salvia miltiorrhiza]|uniref:uncharacterized protein LOC131019033 n=1 Tax=Salvia miltiorrhiza TaxID=226208 RepID=UPI0025ABAF5B|nr:uncharacterized protein LOC131019033 [Salvia miltiorrhiza]
MGLSRMTSCTLEGLFIMHNNEVIGCFHFSGGRGSAFEAELFALIIAIESAHKAGWQHVWFDADSTFVVSLMSFRSLNIPWRFKARWIQALSYAAAISYQISHIFREGNRIADYLASHVKDEGYWPHDVADIRQLVIEDLNLHFFTRVVV